MRKILLLFLCMCAAVCMQSCRKDVLAESMKKLQGSKPEVFSEIVGKNTTLTLVTLCDDGFIGNLEHPHANMLVAEHAAYFKKVCEAIGEVEQAQVRLVYKSKSNGDEQVFEYTTDELKALIENPEKTIQEAREELEQLEE